MSLLYKKYTSPCRSPFSSACRCFAHTRHVQRCSYHWCRWLARRSRKFFAECFLTYFTRVQLSHALRDDPKAPNVQLILADIVEPKAPQGVKAVTVKVDLTDSAQIDALFTTTFGVPDTIYCLHGIMSRGSEDNFDFGLKVVTLSSRP